jgi:ABC-type Fe2+-enterobactin transport system substrate-binding protein
MIWEILKMASELAKKRKIKPFYIDGEAIDVEAVIRQRQELESRIIEDMRLKGYVPVLDITPELFTDFNVDKENFKFAIIVYGTYLGKKKSQQIMGMLGPHQIVFENEGD